MIMILDILFYFLLIFGLIMFLDWLALYRTAWRLVRQHPLGFLIIIRTTLGTKRRYW